MDEKENTSEEMREKSNFDLQEIVKQYPGEDKERVIAALREMERRDVLYSDDRSLLEDLEESKNPPDSKEQVYSPVTPFSIFRDPNIVDDLNAPRLYSRYSIRFFTILFSTLFGGILLSINLNRLGRKREIFYVIGFSLVYSYLVYYLTTLKPESATTITLMMNLLGSLVLEEVFWKNYIGKNFKFRRQPIAGALLVGFGISMFLIYAMFSGG